MGISVGQLAEAAYLSPRQFSPVFRAETGQSSVKAVENLRTEAARLMMEHSRHPIEVIAQQRGFARSRPHAARLPARLRTAAAGNPAKRACAGTGLNTTAVNTRWRATGESQLGKS